MPFGHGGVCCLVSQLIRVHILIDCLLFRLILKFLQILIAQWNPHIESLFVMLLFDLDYRETVAEILRKMVPGGNAWGCVINKRTQTGRWPDSHLFKRKI